MLYFLLGLHLCVCRGNMLITLIFLSISLPIRMGFVCIWLSFFSLHSLFCIYLEFGFVDVTAIVTYDGARKLIIWIWLHYTSYKRIISCTLLFFCVGSFVYLSEGGFANCYFQRFVASLCQVTADESK